jgi:T4-like virus tail tube protein gp19
MSDSEEIVIARPVDGLSRRDLIRAVGLSAGGMALGLSTLGGGSTAQAAVQSTSGVRVALELDGTVTLLKAAEGGNAFADVVLEPPTGDGVQRKRAGFVKFDDLVLQLPFVLSQPLASWINGTLAKAPSARNGALVYLNYDGNELKRLEFFNAVMTEVTLPALDVAARDPVYLTIRLAPESTRLVGPAAKAIAVASLKSAVVLPNAFRLNIQGLEGASPWISKVGALTAKRALVPGDAGQKLKERQFAALDCSLLTITVAESNAGLFYAWFNDFAVNGNNAPGTERAGRLEWLAGTAKVVAAFADLSNLGIVRYALVPIASGADTIASVQVDMYCESFSLTIL